MHSLNIVFTGREQVELREEPVPDLKPGQILVRTEHSLISTGTECICLQSNFAPGTHWDQWVKYPFNPGYSNVGTVIETGPEVTGFEAGDRVATRAHHRQYAVADASRAVKVPAGIAPEDATWFGLACIVQNGIRRAEHELGDFVIIVGLGLLGQLALQYARVNGAHEVVGIDLEGPRLRMAQDHGATRVIGGGVEEAAAAIEEMTGGRGADVVYDITGHAAVFAPALKLCRTFGKLVLIGDTGSPSNQHLTSDFIQKGLRLIAAHDVHPPAEVSRHLYWTHLNMARLFFTYLQREQMRVRDLITHRYTPSQAPDAYHMLLTERASAMGVIFDWPKD